MRTNAEIGNSMRVVRAAPNLRELTTEKLRDAIGTLHFKPGQRLVERVLCEQTGVSRTCIRESLMQLKAEGLVEQVQNKGLYVAAVSLDEARQIYEVRAALEAAVARMFVERATDQCVDALNNAFLRIQDVVERPDVMPYVTAINDFYDILLDGAQNNIAKSVIHNLFARINYLRIITSKKSSREYELQGVLNLKDIVTAASERDGDAMAKHCFEYVNRSSVFALQVLHEKEALVAD